MSWVLAILVVLSFVWVLHQTRLPRYANESVQRARESRRVVRDGSLSDEEKERRLRAEAPRLIGLVARMLLGMALAFGVPLMGLWGLDRLGVASSEEVLAILVRMDFIVAISAVAIALAWLRGRR